MTSDANRSWWWRLLVMARPRMGHVGGLLLLSFVGLGFSLLKPWPLKIVVDYVLPGVPLPAKLQWLMHLPGAGSREGLLSWLTISTVVLFLLGWLISVTMRYVRVDTGGRLTYALAAQVFAHLQRLSLRFHHRRPSGDLVKRIAVDCRCVQTLVMDVFVPAVTAVITLVVVFAIAWRLDSKLALTALLVIPCLGVVLRLYAQPLMDREYEYAELQGAMMAHADRALTGLPIIQVLGREEAEVGQFVDTTQRVGRSYLRTISTGLSFRLLGGSTVAIGTALSLALGGREVLEGRMLLGDLLLFVSYLAFLFEPMETIAYLATSYATAAAGARRVFEVMASDEQVHDAPRAQPLKIHDGGVAVRFEDVSFSYETGKDVLHRVTLAANAGQTIALVGPSGAGKTTIVSLLLRLFDPDTGLITFDGVDIRQYQLASLRERVAIVLQDPFLLPMTIADNIAYARPDASREAVIAAARAAHAEEFVLQLPQGYDTMIGERGATLSGGQRQRLAIARAFLKDAPILILDEPTSSLDTRTEALVLDATARLTRGRTTFIIGHRLSTVTRADMIVVLDNGTVVESGTHQALLATGGLYSRLYGVQFNVASATKPGIGQRSS